MSTTTVKTAKSPNEVRRELKRLGFFHATGLPWIEAEHDEEGHIQAYHQHLGCWGSNNRWTVAVLSNGEVWMLKGEPNNEHKKLLRKICSKGRGASTPCGEAQIIDAEHIADRVRDPYSFCNGYADPEPHPI